MAFAEVRFIKREIEDLLNSSGNSLAAPSRAILEFANREMDSIQEISKRLIPWSRADIALRSEVSKLGKVVKQIVPQSESCEDQIIQKIQEALVQMKTTGEKYVEELYHLPGTGNGKEMVGLVYEFNKLKARFRISRSKSTQVTALVGMTGIGKTTLARKLFDDPQLVEYFECRVWVTLGKECRFREIPRRILAELNAHNGELVEEGDKDIAQQLKEILKDKRFLIVLDDVWDKYMMYHLDSSFKYERNEVKNALHDDKNGSQILFTSRLHQVDGYNARLSSDIMKVRLLNEEESWDLLRKKVFALSHLRNLERKSRRTVMVFLL